MTFSNAPNEDNLETIWKDDLLDRRAEADFLEGFLVGQNRNSTGSFVLNIDADWGVGKTYFLERFKEQLEASGYLVASINAWQDDYTDDPMIAVISEIRNTLQKDKELSTEIVNKIKQTLASVGRLSFEFTKGVAKHHLKKLVGDAMSVLDGEEQDSLYDAGGESLTIALEKFASEAVAQFQETQKAAQSFKVGLRELIQTAQDNKKPFFVIIDELDRCRPTYAIELLERVKHLFDVEGLIFVLATDTSQLAESVKAIYGGGFDGKRYLQRFFDRTYKFERPELRKTVDAALASEDFTTSSLLSLEGVKLSELITNGLQTYKLSTRETIRALDLLKTCSQAWPHDEVKIIVFVILPMIVAHIKGEKIPASEDDLHSHPVLTFSDKSQFEWILTSTSFENTVSVHQIIPEFFKLGRDISNIVPPRPDQETNWSSLPKFNLRHEFQRRFPQSIVRGQKIRSYIFEYPALVRSAGRLTPK